MLHFFDWTVMLTLPHWIWLTHTRTQTPQTVQNFSVHFLDFSTKNQTFVYSATPFDSKFLIVTSKHTSTQVCVIYTRYSVRERGEERETERRQEEWKTHSNEHNRLLHAHTNIHAHVRSESLFNTLSSYVFVFMVCICVCVPHASCQSLF